MYKALLIAGMAAVGNAMFVYGQRRSSVNNYSFSYLIGAVIVCATIVLLVSLIYNSNEAVNVIQKNWVTICVGGIGMATTYLGFYFLYTNYGATYYIVYAVLSIITTSVLVGVVLLGEQWNFYQLIGMLLAIGAIIMFSIGRLVQN